MYGSAGIKKRRVKFQVGQCFLFNIIFKTNTWKASFETAFETGHEY
jgi:hypothetical protein